MRKFLTVILSLILCVSVFALTGCKDVTPSDEDNGGSLDGVTFDARSGEMYKDTKDGKEAIKVTYATGFKDAWIRQAARSFLLDASGSEYYFVLKSDSEITSSLSGKLESESGLSDIYAPLASNWQSYASQGYLENLDSLYETLIPGEEGTILDKVKGTWKTYGKSVRQNEEHYFVFPWNENVTGIVYNKTLFDQYGWQVPQTTDDLAALCAKIVADTKGKIAPFVYPGTVGGYWDFIGTNWWVQLSGIEKMNEFMRFESAEVFNPNKSGSPSEGKLEMLEIFNDIIAKNRESYTLRGSQSKDHLRAQVSFASREAAMIPNGCWIEKESGEFIKDEIRMMRVPAAPGAKNSKVNYSGQPDFMLVPAKASNKEGAKKFLAFMCKDEMLVQYTELTGTARPLTYDLSKCKASDFVKSCLDIYSDSETWFEASTNKLWTANKIKKFNGGMPYTTLLTSDTVTPLGWCSQEYASVSASWDSLLSQV